MRRRARFTVELKDAFQRGEVCVGLINPSFQLYLFYICPILNTNTGFSFCLSLGAFVCAFLYPVLQIFIAYLVAVLKRSVTC